MLGQGCARSSAVTGGGKQQPGRRGGAGRGRQARSYLLAPRAGVEAAGALCGVAAGDTLGCLEGAAGGGGRATVALPQTSASGHFLLPFPPWAHPPSLLISYFHSSPPCAGFSSLRSEPSSPAHSGETCASHEPFVLGPFSIIVALPARGSSLPRRSPVPSPATSSSAEAAVRRPGRRLGERRGPRGKQSCQDLAPGSSGPGSPGVQESEDPAGTAAKDLQTFGTRLTLAHSPSPHSHCPHLKLHRACRGTSVSRRTQWAEMVLNGPLEVPI